MEINVEQIEEFYKQCAIAAMQGLQVSPNTVYLTPNELAEEAFRIADAMLVKYKKRINKYSEQ